MSVVIGVVCEDEGHFTTVTRLIDATLFEHVDWLRDALGHSRSWRGLTEGESWYKYDPADARDLRPIEVGGRLVKPHGHIDGEPLKPEAGMWRKALMLMVNSTPRPEVVILVRDLDGHPARRTGLEQVRTKLDWPFVVVAATAEPEIEAWRVSGFLPNSPDETERLDAVRNDLSFDPTTESHRLTSHPNDARTDAKRVLERLCGADLERTEECLADRERLASRGAANGAAAFIGEVEQRIVPVFRKAS